MGRTLLGGIESEGNVDLLTPEQQNFLSSILGRSNDPGQFNDMFQRSFVNPSLQTLQRQVIPGIKESFLGQDESGSSALNRALAQSATDLSTMLGSQQMNQYNQQIGQGLQASGINQFKPLINQRQGLLPGAINALAAGLGGYVGTGGNPFGALAAALGSVKNNQPNQQMYQ